MSRRVPQPNVSVQELRDLLVAPSHGLMAFPSQPYDEVYPGILIGDAATAFTLSLLKSLRVTHVLNAAQGRDNATYAGCYVNMHPCYYSSAGFGFMSVPAEDAQECNISVHFGDAADFIERVRRQDGKVLVHCVQGLSRSATLVIAYLMIKQGMSVITALTAVRAKRAIFPNYGFLMQLIRLDEQLRADSRESKPAAVSEPSGRELGPRLAVAAAHAPAAARLAADFRGV